MAATARARTRTRTVLVFIFSCPFVDFSVTLSGEGVLLTVPRTVLVSGEGVSTTPYEAGSVVRASGTGRKP